MAETVNPVNRGGDCFLVKPRRPGFRHSPKARAGIHILLGKMMHLGSHDPTATFN